MEKKEEEEEKRVAKRKEPISIEAFLCAGQRLQQWFSKHGTWTNSDSITWECKFSVLGCTYWIRNSGVRAQKSVF